MTTLNLADYDQYGFRIDSPHFTRDQWKHVTIEANKNLTKQQTKWQELIHANNDQLPERSDKIKKLIRKGIPHTLRRHAWLFYSGASDRMVANRGIYVKMLSQETQALRSGVKPANEHIEIIERDLHRTFPDNLYFHRTQVVNAPPLMYHNELSKSQRQESLVGALRRVLVAFSFYQTDIGYCQSLNYVVGLLLILMPEEEAFWMLVVICDELLPKGMYTKTLAGTITEMKVFKDIVHDKCRALVDKVKHGAVMDVDMLVSPWFLTIYVNILPIESLLRTWDCFFFEGSKILYRIALAVLKLVEDEVVKLKDPMEVIQVIQKAPKRMVNGEALLNVAFQRFGWHAIGSLSQVTLDRKRERATSQPSSTKSSTFVPSPSTDRSANGSSSFNAPIATLYK